MQKVNRPNPKWAGFKFGTTRRVRKAAKRKATTPEQELQSFAESILDAYGMSYLRLSGMMFRAIYGNPAIPIHVKKIISDELSGFPDLMIISKGVGGYNRLYCAELKTDIGKLRASQKRRDDEVSFVILRDRSEIQTWIEDIRKCAS